MVPRNVSENQDQPSPISVLEPPFEEDDNITHESSGYMKPDVQGNFSFIVLITSLVTVHFSTVLCLFWILFLR